MTSTSSAPDTAPAPRFPMHARDRRRATLGSTSSCPSTTSRRPRALGPPPARVPDASVPVRLADRHRRQREHRRHPVTRPRARRRAARRERPPARRPRAAAGRCAPPGQRQRRRRPLLHGRRSLDRPAARCCRSSPVSSPGTATSRSAPAWPPASRVVRGPRARVHLPHATTASCASPSGPASPTPSAASRRSAPTPPAQLLPEIEDEGWFFDTELLVLAQRRGLRIHEVAVDWIDDPDSRVDIVSHRAGRPARRAPAAPGHVRSRASCSIGVASTIAYALPVPAAARRARRAGRQRAGAGPHRGRQHRRPTAASPSASAGARGLVRQHAAGALVYLLALGLTGGALAVLQRPRPPSVPAARGDGARRRPAPSPPSAATSRCAPGCSPGRARRPAASSRSRSAQPCASLPTPDRSH